MNCVWNGQLVCVKDCTLLLQALREEDHEWSLSPAADPLTLASNCLSMASVFDCIQGQASPFLLTSQHCSHHYQLIQYNTTDNTLATKCSFDWDHELLSLAVLDGPLLMLASTSTLTLVDCNTGSQQYNIDIAELLKYPVTIFQAWAFAWYEDSVLVMLQLRKVGGAAHWSSVVLQQDGGVSESQEFVPCEYGSMATCIECSQCVSVSRITGDFEVCKRFYVGTSYKQMVVFGEGGALLYCVTLNTAPTKIVILESSDESLSLAVHSDSDCIAYKLTDTALKEVGCWSNVCDVIAGNLAHVGHSQLLILKHNDIQGKQDFIATDLNLFSTEDSPMEDQTDGGSNTSLADTVKAFQLRKHDGMVQLTELEAEIQQKALLIHSSLVFMSSLGSSDMQPPPTDSEEALMCIVPGGGGVKGVVERRHSRLLDVEHVWKRLEDDQLIVGMLIKNISEQTLSKVHCTLVLPCEATPTESSSHILWNSSLDALTSQDNDFLSHFPSPVKRRRLEEALGTGRRGVAVTSLEPGGTMCVVSSATLVCRGAVGGALVVCVRSVEGVCAVDVPVQLKIHEVLSQELRVKRSCLRLWKAVAVLTGQEETGEVDWTDKEVQDLATLMSVRRITKIVITTQDTSWPQLISLMSKTLHLSYLMLVATPPITHHADIEGGPLDGVAVCVRPISESTANMAIMYRSEPQLVLLLTMLKQTLPSERYN